VCGAASEPARRQVVGASGPKLPGGIEIGSKGCAA
jgi:hypothetical protein